MAITTFSTLKSAAADWLDRDDIGDAIETMIGLAEARIYRELRIRAMESALSVSISSGVAAVPADYQELRFAYLDTTPVQHLQISDPEWLYAIYPTRSASGAPQYISREGLNFIFGPYPDSGYTLKGIYYASLTAMSVSNETNWFTANAPDLLLYGTLAHSALYLGQDARLDSWEAAYQEAKNRVVAQDKQERYPRGMSLSVRTA